jgi:mono/diheme cytochrome c family protein
MERRSVAVLAIAAVGALALTWDSLQAQKPADTLAAVDFTRDIQPILQTNCYECHGADKSKGKLRLDIRAAAMKGGETGPVIIPGKSSESLLVRRILGLDGDDRMPKDGDALAAPDVAKIRAWIDQGATWPASAAELAAPTPAPDPEPKHWAYRVPKPAPPPDVRNSKWVRTPIDQFVLARLEKEGLEPSAEAPLETLVRRVSLDLIGLPPSLKELDEVIADAARDGRDAAYVRLVDRLLASPHYGERWARPWLDLARYADSHGFEKDLPRVMWKYRDWVIDAFNNDMPFDRFTIEQIGGDMLANATRDQIVASGFHRNAMTNEEGGIDPEEAHYEVLVDRVNTTSTVWLGTTLGCSQCHNHKYDPFTQKDYFRMMAFFTNTDYEVRKLGDGTKFTETTIDLPTPEQEAARKTIQEEMDELNEKMKAETPALEHSQAVWERAMQNEASLRWQALVPATVTATAGVILTAGRDHSVTASGPNPGSVVYTVETRTALPKVTAVRLEALPDPALPKGGPGRDVYGNFQVNAVEIESAPVGLKASDFASVRFKAIKSDDGGATMDSFFPKNLPRDAYAPRGWRIDASREETRLPRQVVFSLDRPLVNVAGTRLRIKIKHQQVLVGQSLGRFRLSVTSSATPQRVVEIPARLRPLLTVTPAGRTEQQTKELKTVYRNVAVSLRPLRDRLTSLQKELTSLNIPTAMVMRERNNHERPSAYVRRRGSFLDKGEKVYADVPATLHPLGADQMPNRLGLARWLVDERNPLTARVAVNRAWEQFFGRGIVETSEDFGTQGSMPSHPELLDWLATELVEGDWRMKALHKLIVTSATYRQSSVVSAGLAERDPYNRLLARGPRFRMEAEMVRDSVLAASGLLTEKIGGPSVFPPQPEGIWDIPYSNEKWIGSAGDDRYRRGLYTFIRRSAAYPSFMTFDATSREFCTVRRVRTNTPLQALTTLNDEAFFEAARALAARVLKESTASDEDRAKYGFRLAVSRTPVTAEVQRIVKSFNDHLSRFRKDADAAAVVIRGYAVPGIDPAEQAAWTLVSNALLNLDEALTKE